MPTVAQHFGSRAPHVRRASQGRAPHNAPVVLMVSGGADSTALLLMACTSTLDIQDGRGPDRIARERLHVLHVNHHLRGAASDADEAFVRDLAKDFGLPICVEHAQLAQFEGQNVEAAARDIRYAAARRYVDELCRELGTRSKDARILTAHTASDRTETFLMNAIKGSGPAGLSSIPRRRGIIVRPLMGYTHADLTRYLRVHDRSWCEDESNADTSYLRNFVRHNLVPLARERNGNLEHTVSASCDILHDEDSFLQNLATTALRTCTRRAESGLMVLDAARLAASEIVIARRMVRLAVRAVDAEARLEMAHVERVLALVAAGEGSATLPAGLDARAEFGTLTLRTPSAREELAAGWLAVPGSMPLANGCVLQARMLRVEPGQDPVFLAREASAQDTFLPATCEGASTVLLDAESLGFDVARPQVRLWVDGPAPGDVMCPLGMHGRTRKISDILGTAQVPVALRPATPVVRTAPSGAVAWLAGIRLDDRFKCAATSKTLVELTIRSVMAT